MAPLVACPHCNVHAKLSELVCPHCGNTIRRADGSIAKTAAAVVLGLTVAASGAAGCGESVDEYGVAATGSTTTTTSASAGGQGGVGGAGGAVGAGGNAGVGGAGGAGGADPTPEYGAAGAGG